MIRDGEIVRGELIYDAQDLRQAMAVPPVVALLETACQSTADMLGLIGDEGWAAPSRCTRWSVRQAGNHLVGALLLLARVARWEQIEPAELDAQRTAETDHLGADPAGSFQHAAAGAVETFRDPAVLEQRFDIPAQGTTGCNWPPSACSKPSCTAGTSPTARVCPTSPTTPSSPPWGSTP